MVVPAKSVQLEEQFSNVSEVYVLGGYKIMEKFIINSI